MHLILSIEIGERDNFLGNSKRDLLCVFESQSQVTLENWQRVSERDYGQKIIIMKSVLYVMLFHNEANDIDKRKHHFGVIGIAAVNWYGSIVWVAMHHPQVRIEMEPQLYGNVCTFILLQYYWAWCMLHPKHTSSSNRT